MAGLLKIPDMTQERIYISKLYMRKRGNKMKIKNINKKNKHKKFKLKLHLN